MSEELKQTRTHFSSVKKAREVLRERATEILEAYMGLAAQAAAEKDFETAADILWKLLDHTPEEDGERVLDSPASKPLPSQSQGPAGPSIQIGIALGGIGEHKALPSAQVIDVSPIHDPKESK